MGERLLRYSLKYPFVKEKLILERQKAVTSFVDLGEKKLAQVRANLKHCFDIERLLTRVLSLRARAYRISKN